MIPALYELARELYDRRTGLIAAAFAAVSPVLIWYSQEVRMYEFAALFGLLALLTQLRAIRNGTMLNWAAYILATAALLWSHYFGLLADRRPAADLHRSPHPPPARRRAGQAAGTRRSRTRSPMLVMQLVPLAIFAHHQYQVTHRSGRLSERNLRPAVLLLDPREHGLVALGLSARRGDGAPGRDVAAVLLGSLVLLGRGGSRQTTGSPRPPRSCSSLP